MFLYCSQSFSLPNSIIYYITKNPATPEAYKKLVKTCKYFFAKNPILVLQCLYFNNDDWKIFTNSSFTEEPKKIEIKKSFSKFWITETLSIKLKFSNHCNIASWFIQRKLFRHKTNKCSLSLYLSNQTICLNELAIFNNVNLENVSVKDEYGIEAELQTIVSEFTDAKSFVYKFGNHTIKCSRDTVEKIINVPNFSNINRFILENIPENFDIVTFYEYLKKHKCMSAVLRLNNLISPQYLMQVKEIILEIFQMSVKSAKYVPLVIIYDGQDLTETMQLEFKQRMYDGRYIKKERKKLLLSERYPTQSLIPVTTASTKKDLFSECSPCFNWPELQIPPILE